MTFMLGNPLILRLCFVGCSAIIPLLGAMFLHWDFLGEDFPLFLGLILQAYLGFSAFALVQSYETTGKLLVTIGYFIFWLSLGFCYLAGKSLFLPLFLEIASFSTILIYSATGFRKEQIESLSSLLFASGISALFLAGWVFLPDEDPRGVIFLTLGLLIKSGFSGFHFWLPKVNEGGPSHALGSFAGALEIFPLLLFVRYAVPLWTEVTIYQALFPLAALGIFFGGITALFHRDPKKALAYSSIESINFLWLCIAIFGLFQKELDPDLQFLSKSFLILFYISLLHHSFSKSFQLFSIGMVARMSRSNSSDEMKGIGRLIGSSPFFLGIGTFSYAVLPGTIGFVSEATYLYLNAKILDMPIGRSVFLLPAMIFIFFGIISGGFAHIRLYATLFLSFPSPKEQIEPLKPSQKHWINVSLASLSVMILGFPLVFPFLLKFPPFSNYVLEDFQSWANNLAFVSAICTFFVASLVFFRWSHKVEKRKFWDCGNNYYGPELSIPASVFSEPLRNSLGRYFLNKDGASIIDDFILKTFQRILDTGDQFIKKEFNHEEDISRYLMTSSLFLIFILSLVILSFLGITK